LDFGVEAYPAGPPGKIQLSIAREKQLIDKMQSVHVFEIDHHFEPLRSKESGKTDMTFTHESLF
jgi:hypothetical protein